MLTGGHQYNQVAQSLLIWHLGSRSVNQLPQAIKNVFKLRLCSPKNSDWEYRASVSVFRIRPSA